MKHSENRNFNNLSFFISSDLGEQKFFFLQFLVDISIYGSVNPHIFADPDPGRQNLADPNH